ncbi:MAG: hypothetical protein NVS9B10_11120 [Nevskia sp.]
MSTLLKPLPWQLALWQPVAAAIAGDRLGHALLLAGPAGTGKRHFARCLAAALWCRVRAPDGTACGDCPDCRQVLSEAHSGYHFLRVEDDKKDIAIDAVRELGERLQMTSHDGRAKVAIIEPADALNTNGVNALLKTIEEPSAHSHLLLVSERPQALTATLRSRCQRLRFAVPPAATAMSWLRTQTDLQASEEELAEALRAAQGSPLRARHLIESKSLAQFAGWAKLMMELAGARAEPVPAAAAVGDANAGPFAHWLFGWLTRLLRARAGQGQDGDEELGRLGSSLPAELLERYIAEVHEALYRVQTTANKTLLLESLLIGWRGLLARSARSAQNAPR